MRIVGLKPLEGTGKKTQKPFSGVVVSCCGPARETVGEGVVEQFVDSEMFKAATGGAALRDLIGKQCRFDRDPRGYVEGFELLK